LDTQNTENKEEPFSHLASQPNVQQRRRIQMQITKHTQKNFVGERNERGHFGFPEFLEGVCQVSVEKEESLEANFLWVKNGGKRNQKV
jgi:hypothetical protein